MDVSDKEQYNEADLKFHQLLARATDNPFLFQLGKDLASALKVGFQGSFDRTPNHRSGLDMHGSILNAIRLRDAEGARKAMSELILSTEAGKPEAFARQSVLEKAMM